MIPIVYQLLLYLIVNPSSNSKTALVQDIGITSLIYYSNNNNNFIPVDNSNDISNRIFAGTKRGDVLQIQFVSNNNNNNNSSLTSALEDIIKVNKILSHNCNNDKKSRIKLPIFSLAVIGNKESFRLFTGGGDRFVSIFECKQTNSNKYHWHRVSNKRLGPHTGWVKSIQVGNNNNYIYSIGCNRIECWNIHNYEKIGTILVDNSIVVNRNIGGKDNGNLRRTNNDVCTLSSDLLCLVLCNLSTTNTTGDILAAGGVDGRIRFFSTVKDYNDSSSSSKFVYKTLSVIDGAAVHDGRVNALAYHPK